MNISVPSTVAAVRPNFISMVQAEIFKIRHQRPVWVMGIIIAAVLFLYGLRSYFLLQYGHQFTSTDSVYIVTQIGLSDIRGFLGIFMTVLAVITVGLEYQQGTIRVLLARGVGRLRLLGAKLTAIALTGLVAYAAALVVMLLSLLVSFALSNHTGDLGQVPSFFWSDILLSGLATLISMFITALLAATLSVLGRSLALGLSVTLPWFFAEFILSIILTVIGGLSSQRFWFDLSGYLLGVNLSGMGLLIIPNRGNASGVIAGFTGNTQPLVLGIDGAHTLVVTLVYAAIFVGVSGVITWKRDVLQ